MKEIWQQHWEEILNMLGTNFKNKVKNSFRKLKLDISALKENLSEWIMFLDSNQRDLQLRIKDLERRIEYMERNNYNERLELLRR